MTPMTGALEKGVSPMKVLVVVGTRPEAIKLAPVLLALRESDKLEPVLCVTAQHRQLLDDALAEFGLCADLDLDLMEEGQRPTELLARAVPAIGSVIDRVRPDCVLAQGDTTTTLAAGLAAFYARVPFVHVEAGLRTGRLDAPWPEEMNRVLTAQLATLHVAPTALAAANLRLEGIEEERIHLTGNTIVDALEAIRQRNRTEPPALPPVVAADPDARWVVVTAHRRESHGRGLERICAAVLRLRNGHPDWRFLVSVHPNPRVREPLRRLLDGQRGIHLLDPPPYRAFVAVLERADLVLTDSGGIQEEALCLGKPVVVLREHTERPELVVAGLGTVAGTDTDAIVAAADRMVESPPPPPAQNPLGDGHAARRIVELLESLGGACST